MNNTPSEPVDTGVQQFDIAARIEAEAKAPEPAKDAEQEADDQAEETQNKDTESSANSDGDDAPADTPKKKPGVHNRIGELTREKYDAIRESDRLREENARLRAQVTPKPEANTQAATQDDGRPRLEDFDFDPDAHSAALVEWTLDQRDRKAEEAKAKEQQQERISKFDEQAAAFAAANPDFYDRIQSPDLQVTQAMKEVVLETENPPAIAYHLATHPDEAAAIAKMTPLAAARAIGRIEASLSAPNVRAETPRQPVSVTKAPAPVATLKSAGTVSKDLDQLSMAEYVAERNKQAQRGR